MNRKVKEISLVNSFYFQVTYLLDAIPVGIIKNIHSFFWVKPWIMSFILKRQERPKYLTSFVSMILNKKIPTKCQSWIYYICGR